MKAALLLRPVRYASMGVVLSCACSAGLGALGVTMDQHARSVLSRPSRLLVSTLDPVGHSGDLLADVQRLLGDERAVVRPLPRQVVREILGSNDARPAPSLPEIVEVELPAPLSIEALVARLHARRNLIVQQLSNPAATATRFYPVSWLLVLIALLNAGWSGHRNVQHRAPLLRLLHQIGCTPGRLAGEALAPIAASGAVGATAGGALTAICLVGSLGPMVTPWLIAVLFAVVAAPLLGGLGALRSIVAALP